MSMNDDNHQLKKISTVTIEKINRISPEQLEDHGVIKRARVSGFICPLCGSGNGQHGTGMTHNKRIESHTSFTCYACGKSFNVLTLCSAHYDLDTRTNFVQLVERICEDFGIWIRYDDFTMANEKRNVEKKRERPRKSFSAEELAFIREDLNAPIEPLRLFMQGLPNQTWRGFNFEFLEKYGCRLIYDWAPPKNRKATKSIRMLIPAGEKSYLARLVDKLSNYDARVRPYIKEKVHAGKKEIFNADALNSAEPVFVVEGYIDAMSIELAGFNAVALGGRGEVNLLLNAVDKLTDKPALIVMLDSDKQGRDSAPTLRENLLKRKCPCVVRFLADEETKLDVNDILQRDGVDALRGILQDIVSDSLPELDIVKNEVLKKEAFGLTDEDWTFIFSGNSSDLHFARRLERFCRNQVRWLLDEECWLIFNGKTWARGTDKNYFLYPFARKLAETMEHNAEKKEERTLAEKFQSAKRINSAITLLKSYDSMIISAKDLNQRNDLFCVQNGVINLRTGELLPHSPEYLITQTSPAIYRPGYRNPVVENFLRNILPDDDTRNALIRYLGYAATGEVNEERALFFYGAGGNGKGTLTRTLIHLFGDYATTLKTGTVLQSTRAQDVGAATTELNPLENCRLAVVEELPQGGRLDVSKFKNLTGGDLIPIRKLHKEQVNIEPHFSPILSGNYRPELSNTHDPGLLRRLMNIDFTCSFVGENRDPYLKKKLIEPDALSGLLTLIVDAAVLWYRDGLLESSAMKQATREFLNENDFIGDFISEFCEFGHGLSIPRKKFLERLKSEYSVECAHLFNNRDRALVDAVRRIDGIGYDNRGGTYKFHGIGWRTITAS